MIEHREIEARVLRMIRRDVAETLTPELSSGFALYSANSIVMILDHLIEWIGKDPDPSIDADRRALLAKLGGAIAQTQGLSPDFGDASEANGALAALIARADAGDDRALLAGAGAELPHIEHRLFEAEAAAPVAATAADAERMATVEVDVTPDLVDAYLAGHPTLPKGRTTSVTKIPGGHSKDTFLITLDSGADLVIRRDFPYGPTQQSAADEFGVLDRLHGLGFPVARPLASEHDTRPLGQKFLVLEKMPGRNALHMSREDPAFGRKVSVELARYLGRLHSLDPAQAGFDAPSDPREAVRLYIDEWRQWWHRNRIHSSALIELAFAWVERNIPANIARVVIVHGDFRADNMLADENGVTALLDWEFAHAGDPSEDLEYTRMYLEDTIDWADFEAEYLAAGGAPTTAETALFYEVWRSLRNFVCIEASWQGFLSGRYPVIKLGVQGVVYRRWFLRALAEVMRRVPW